jgi:hypothetical protein
MGIEAMGITIYMIPAGNPVPGRIDRMVNFVRILP